MRLRWKNLKDTYRKHKDAGTGSKMQCYGHLIFLDALPKQERPHRQADPEFYQNLISSVRKHSCLYDPNDPNYLCKDSVGYAWQDVIGSLQFGGDQDAIILKWKYLCRKYVQENRKIRSLGNDGSENPPTWQHYKELVWMNHFLAEAVEQYFSSDLNEVGLAGGDNQDGASDTSDGNIDVDGSNNHPMAQFSREQRVESEVRVGDMYPQFQSAAAYVNLVKTVQGNDGRHKHGHDNDFGMLLPSGSCSAEPRSYPAVERRDRIFCIDADDPVDTHLTATFASFLQKLSGSRKHAFMAEIHRVMSEFDESNVFYREVLVDSPNERMEPHQGFNEMAPTSSKSQQQEQRDGGYFVATDPADERDETQVHESQDGDAA